MSSAALTGHRPKRLGLKSIDVEINQDWRKIIDWLKDTILKYEITETFCGMADGCDIAYGIAVKELKEEGHIIKLNCILPCKNYDSKCNWHSILKDVSDNWVELNPSYHKNCDDERDQYMVDNSDMLIAIWDGIDAGGVYNTILKAKKQNKNIVYYVDIMKDNMF